MTVTGLLLNHADSLGLPVRHPGSQFVHVIYGIESPAVDASFAAGGSIFASANGTLYANGLVLAEESGRLLGAVVNSADETVIATSTEVLLTTPGGAVIERKAIDPDVQLVELGFDGNQVIARTYNGYVAFDPQAMTFSAAQPASTARIAWAATTELDSTQESKISENAVGQAITWERVLADLHSGRILPVVGLLIVDVAGVCLLYLCFSGLMIWLRTR